MSRSLFAVLVGITSLAIAEEAQLVDAPKVTRDGESVRISFSVNAATDVEVAILHGDGKVVRHLAAGVLGGKNPPPRAIASRPLAGIDLGWQR